MPSSIASRRQRSSSTVPGVAFAIALNLGMISRSKKTCIRKTFSSSVSAPITSFAISVEVRVALPVPAGLGDQLQPRLGMARLVLHHRRVVQLRLGWGASANSWVAISTASSSAWSCWVITERQTSRRRAWRWGEPRSSGIGERSPQGRSRTIHSAFLASV